MNKILTVLMMLASAACSLDSLSVEKYGSNYATNAIPGGKGELPGEAGPDAPKTYPNSYYVELWVKGESSQGSFSRYNSFGGSWIYAYGIDIQIMHLDRQFVSYSATYNSGDGSSYYYGFSDKSGNNFNMLRYLKGENMKTPTGSNKIHLYYWVKNMAHLFCRENVYITIPVDQYDSKIHTNIARFTLTVYPDDAHSKPDKLEFDGFALK